MAFIANIARSFSQKARQRRASMFRRTFRLDENTRILDLGSESGAHINMVLQGTPVKPEHVYIADIDPALIEQGKQRFGYVPVLISESGQLPFADQFFDIIYCSSVIEHVTVPKEEIWSLTSGRTFRRRALLRQKTFANEVRRLGKQYFVQTPYRHFPIESHTWLPLAAWLPRRLLLPLLRLTNRFWPKKTQPDWYLLNKRELAGLFEDATIVEETSLGLTKSIMAVKVGGG